MDDDGNLEPCEANVHVESDSSDDSEDEIYIPCPTKRVRHA